MYGMVNRGIEELVVKEQGLAAWEDVKRSSGVEVDIFISNDSYPDKLTYLLVGAASERLGISLQEFLRRFGIHWVMTTAKDNYEDLLCLGGASLLEFLVNLPKLHERISVFLPHLDPPTFSCSDVTDHSLRLHYYSHRLGLTHFVEGLILGLGLYFQTPVEVSIAAEKAAGADHDEFLIRW